MVILVHVDKNGGVIKGGKSKLSYDGESICNDVESGQGTTFSGTSFFSIFFFFSLVSFMVK